MQPKEIADKVENILTSFGFETHPFKNITRTQSRLPVPTQEITNRKIQFQSRISHRSGKRQLSKTPIKSPFRFPLYKASPAHKRIKRISSRRLFNGTSVSCHNELQVDNTITIPSIYVDSQSDTDTASETQDDHSNKTTDQIKTSNKTTCIYGLTIGHRHCF